MPIQPQRGEKTMHLVNGWWIPNGMTWAQFVKMRKDMGLSTVAATKKPFIRQYQHTTEGEAVYELSIPSSRYGSDRS